MRKLSDWLNRNLDLEHQAKRELSEREDDYARQSNDGYTQFQIDESRGLTNIVLNEDVEKLNKKLAPFGYSAEMDCNVGNTRLVVNIKPSRPLGVIYEFNTQTRVFDRKIRVPALRLSDDYFYLESKQLRTLSQVLQIIGEFIDKHTSTYAEKK